MSFQKHILCVDDDKDSCELITYMLKAAHIDFEVTAVNSSSEAVNLITEKAFDLYILDYRLPGISGIELCELIRETDTETPVIFFSAMAFDKDRKAALEAGANAYLVKPNDVGRFTETVGKLLKNAR
ncbi:MAG: response regulator [Pyrinomonadaceae bacterium]